MCLCHLPVSDVDELVSGHRQGEGGQVTSAERPGDIGSHALQEGNTGRALNTQQCRLYRPIWGTMHFVGRDEGHRQWEDTDWGLDNQMNSELLVHLVNLYKVFGVHVYFTAPKELWVWQDAWRERGRRREVVDQLYSAQTLNQSRYYTITSSCSKTVLQRVNLFQLLCCDRLYLIYGGPQVTFGKK